MATFEVLTSSNVIGGGGGSSYLVYTALLTQSGTNAPVATELENTLGGTVVWTRDDVGQYTETLSNAFTLNKTVCVPFGGDTGGLIVMGIANSLPFDYGYGLTAFDVNTCKLYCYQSSDYSNVDLSTAVSANPIFIEIRVYP